MSYIRLMSNLYIIFSFKKIGNDNDMWETLDEIIDKLNRYEDVYIRYNHESIDAFTTYLSDILRNCLKIERKESRIDICRLNNIIINPVIM